MNDVKSKLVETLWWAEEVTSGFEGGYSNQFIDASDFHKALKSSVAKFENGDDSVLEKIYVWFLPTSDFDDFVGFAGMELANEICKLIEQYKPSFLDT